MEIIIRLPSPEVCLSVYVCVCDPAVLLEELCEFSEPK